MMAGLFEPRPPLSVGSRGSVHSKRVHSGFALSSRACRSRVVDGTGASIGSGADRAICTALHAPSAANRDASSKGYARRLVGWLRP